MTATVSHISPVNRIFGIGTVPPADECIVPAGSSVCQLKHCELCGTLFTRERKETVVRGYYETRFHSVAGDSFGKAELRRDVGERLCRNCHKCSTIEEKVKQLSASQEKHKQHLPNLDIIHASSRPIRYPRPKVSREEYLRQGERSRQAIKKAFAEKGQLSTEELQAILFNCYSLSSVHWRVKCLGFKLQKVATLPSKTGIGRGIGVYSLPEVIQ